MGDRAGGASRGSVTAEFAVVLPVVVVLLATLLAAGAAGVAQVRCVDAARSGARLAARHEPEPVILAAARSAAPDGAQVHLSAAEGLVRVQVTARLRLPLPGRPSVGLGAVALARAEEQPGG